MWVRAKIRRANEDTIMNKCSALHSTLCYLECWHGKKKMLLKSATICATKLTARYFLCEAHNYKLIG